MCRVLSIVLFVMLSELVLADSPTAYNNPEVLDLLDSRLSFYGALLVGTLSVFSGVFLLIARWLWGRHTALDTKIESHIRHTETHLEDIHGRITDSCNDVTEKIHTHEIEVARVYAPRQEINDNIDRAVNPMKQRIDEIYDLVLYQVRGNAHGRPSESP